MIATDTNQARSIPGILLLAWSGYLIHDLVEFGAPSTQSSLPNLIVAALLFLAWQQFRQRRTAVAYVMIAWGIWNIFGAVVSVIPFSFLPFYPEQSLVHYGVHLLLVLVQQSPSLPGKCPRRPRALPGGVLVPLLGGPAFA